MTFSVAEFPRRVCKPKSMFYFDENVFASEVLKELCGKTQTVILADSAVSLSFGETLREFLGANLISILGGERCKTRAMKQWIEDQLLKQGYGKDTTLIALGGGALSDLVGFIAMSYMRGVSLVLIPTTLLGMVDASIGGKNAINTSFGKNTLGSIYHPKAVFLDSQLLSSLPSPEWQNGIAEILKLGLVLDKNLWDLCAQDPPPWDDPVSLKRLIYAAVLGKLHVLEEDVESQGMRHILNFGHTIGHALELLSHFKLPHGKAVASGCLAEGYLSHKLGHLSTAEWKKIELLYKKRGFNLQFSFSVTKEKLKKALSMDKKAIQGQPRFVSLEKIGSCVPFEGRFCETVDEKSLDAMLDWMLH